ncbi:hypothetical protein ACFYZB_12305 [Streptomyces sp. NPDC001852]|uniref:hypothetical protein n=1 Tax=Streptomyces sp. NPDC001852 TaxID=3364619 RepID=UPI0036C89CD4
MTAPNPKVADEPTDPGVDLRVPAQRRQQSWRAQGPIAAVVAVGAAVGACARYGASLVWPAAAGSLPWIRERHDDEEKEHHAPHHPGRPPQQREERCVTGRDDEDPEATHGDDVRRTDLVQHCRRKLLHRWRGAGPESERGWVPATALGGVWLGREDPSGGAVVTLQFLDGAVVAYTARPDRSR